jgi:hypothetical protein
VGFFRLRTGVRAHLFLAKGGHEKVEFEVVFLDADRDAGLADGDGHADGPRGAHGDWEKVRCASFGLPC